MYSEVILTIGSLALCFSIPLMVAAYADQAAPRKSAILAILGLLLIVAAVVLKPGGYQLAEVPDAYASAVAYILH
ncbi:hypothetical protein ERN12_10585 [Rhodobacteraceae bacterium]|nr:hypothetical protein ERN12_10585 [Paracoccaceae bacterium]